MASKNSKNRTKSIYVPTTPHKSKRFTKREFVKEEDFLESVRLEGVHLSSYFLLTTTNICTDNDKAKKGWFEKAENLCGYMAGDFLEEKPGVYEVAIRLKDGIDEDNEYVPIKFGSTNNIRVRILRQYGRDGSDIALWLRPYIEKGFEVHFRYAYTKNYKTVEVNILKWDYPACHQHNPPVRNALWKERQLSEAGIVEVVLDNYRDCLHNLDEIRAEMLEIEEPESVEEGEENIKVKIEVLELQDEFDDLVQRLRQLATDERFNNLEKSQRDELWGKIEEISSTFHK